MRPPSRPAKRHGLYTLDELQKLSKGLTTRTGDSPDACWL